MTTDPYINPTNSQQTVWQQIRSQLRQTFLIKGPAKFLQAWIIGGPVAGLTAYVAASLINQKAQERDNLIRQEANQRDERLLLEKDVEILEQTIREVFHAIKSLETFPRMNLFFDFDPDKIKADIVKLKLTLSKVVSLREKNKTIKNLQDKISREEKTLNVAIASLGALLLHHKGDFDKAQQELDKVQPEWQSLFDGILKLDIEEQEQLRDVLSNAYNVRGIVLRANIKTSKRDQCFTLAALSFLMGLRAVLPAKQSNLNPLKDDVEILELIKKELDSLVVSFAKAQIPEKEVYGVLLSNLGFLLNQWNKNEEALRCHKIAYDLFPHSCAVVNGLAHGLTQMGIFSENKIFKNDCYEKAEELYERALKLWPGNHVVISNYAEMYLERAEETVDVKKKESYYKKAKELLKPVIEQKEGEQNQKIWIRYAIALSNLGEKETARECLEKGKICLSSDRNSSAYINTTLLLKKEPYRLPPFGGNRELRKGFESLGSPPNFSNVKVEFSESNLLKTKIETDRTIIRPIQVTDQMFVWERLYGNKDTMRLYHNRIPRDLKTVSDYVEKWHALFKAGVPYSAYVVVSKTYPSERIGLIVLEASPEHEAEPGLTQLFYLFEPSSWDNHYGRETLDAFMNCFVQKYLIHNPKFLVLGQPLKVTEMCALVENTASNSIINNCFQAKLTETKERYGDNRHTYQIEWPLPV